jgi:hypothetical protein
MVYTNNQFTGHYPVGTAAVVRAPNRTKAAEALNTQLRKQGLPGDAKPEDMKRFLMHAPHTYARKDIEVRILGDGDY